MSAIEATAADLAPDEEALDPPASWSSRERTAALVAMVAAVAALAASGASILWAERSLYAARPPWFTARVDIAVVVARWSIAVGVAVDLVAIVVVTLGWRREQRAIDRAWFALLAPVVVADVVALGITERDFALDSRGWATLLGVVLVVLAAEVALALASGLMAWRAALGALLVGSILAVGLVGVPLVHAPEPGVARWYVGHQDAFQDLMFDASAAAGSRVAWDTDDGNERADPCASLSQDLDDLSVGRAAPPSIRAPLERFVAEGRSIAADCPSADDARERLVALFTGPDASAIDRAVHGAWRVPLS